MKNKIIRYGLPVLLWMVYTFPAIAQPVEPPTEEDPLEPDPTPIDNWILFLVFLSVALGICYFRNREIKNNAL